MLIAHLPAGYLAAKGAQGAGASKAVFWGILLGSIAPDFDMLWFFFVDSQSTHHHDYLTHRPILWAGLLLFGLLLRRPFLIAVGCGALFHLMLDSIAGKVSWGWPFFEGATTLVTVQATQGHWIKSFMAHWTFKVECLIVLVAVAVYLRSTFKGKSE
ncbi:metal-dependent hydrolase [Shimia sp. R11_0]|uniref:metal-dependent hydrolase n=1 Tax=Shimia sp. R11_0 TaxID=2821096 RepID=UPI001ADC8BF0|nr:metal-dependent hydrolase [Shimia sp. R11_0]